MDFILFSRYFLLIVGLEKWSKNLVFENFYEILSLLDFEFVARALLRLSSSFSSQLILLMVVQEKEYMKLDAGKVIDNMTRGSCIPIDSVKSSDDYFSLIHSIGTGHVLIWIRLIRHTRLVKVMICRVGNI